MGKSSSPSRAPELKALKHVTFLNKSSCAGTWTVKEHDISKDRWPVSQTKFGNRSRSEANTITS